MLHDSNKEECAPIPVEAKGLAMVNCLSSSLAEQITNQGF
jgi:hypothetical protein